MIDPDRFLKSFLHIMWFYVQMTTPLKELFEKSDAMVIAEYSSVIFYLDYSL